MTASRFLRGSSQRPSIVAHRGHWHKAPENSLAAMDAAFTEGADIVVIDIRRTADGAFVVMHDETLDRTTDMTGPVNSLSLRQLDLARLRKAAGGEEAALTDHRLPTLQQALLRARGRGMVALNLPDDADIAECAAEIAAMDMSLSTILRAEVTCAEDGMRLLRKVGSSAVFMPQIVAAERRWLPALIQDLRGMALPCFEARCGSIEEVEDIVVMARAQNAGIWINTLASDHIDGLDDARALEAPEAVWGQLIGAGVSVIQTDEVEALARQRKRLSRAA